MFHKEFFSVIKIKYRYSYLMLSSGYRTFLEVATMVVTWWIVFFCTVVRVFVIFCFQPQIVQGTVPYLGTFLTDLNMVDTANPDTTKDGLINFDKKRKEFEILAQIRLLQSAASMYRFKPDAAFFEWFHSIRIYDDSER